MKAPVSAEYAETRSLMREHNLVTVCEEAACPNIGECWAQKHATMMILGSVCTRACAFCNVATGRPDLLDPHEPENVGAAVAKLALRHVVITSVDRDDLDDGGAEHFARTITAIREQSPGTTIEILTPDFLRKDGASRCRRGQAGRVQPQYGDGAAPLPVDQARRALFPLAVDPAAGQEAGPVDLHQVRHHGGAGESDEEVGQLMDDLRSADVDFMTIGQYLQPTPKHAPVDRFVEPSIFESYAKQGKAKGFLWMSSTPLTRPPTMRMRISRPCRTRATPRWREPEMTVHAEKGDPASPGRALCACRRCAAVS